MTKQTRPNQGNMFLVMVLTGLMLFGWPVIMRHFYPEAPHKVAASAVQQPAAATGSVGSGPAAADPANLKPTREGGLSDAGDQALEAKQLAAKLAPAGRVAIAAPALSGSINLAGGGIDDLTLNHYKASLDKTSGPVRLFSPAGTVAQQFAQVGWLAPNGTTLAAGTLPDGNTVWAAPADAKLTPATPVVLTWSNPQGATFTITYAIDADYMISVTQSVANKGGAPLTIVPVAMIDRTNRTASMDSWNIHSGPFGAFDGGVNFETGYKDGQVSRCVTRALFFCASRETATQLDNSGTTNWLGFTDIYWMSVLVPGAPDASSKFRALGGGNYTADLSYKPQTIAPGASAQQTTRLFAGAKESALLDRYEAGANGQPGIVNFGHAIDWGWFFWFEKPIFWLLRHLFGLAGNFGVAIILLTFVVRGLMYPVAHRQFGSMAAMRSLQPKMKALQERYKDDKAQLQQETMKLYKEEGVNPLAGCAPILLQIPVFFALYKVLMVAIEMRQQPFVLWIKDLSVPDPAHILNLFGLLPFTPPAMLGVGILAVLLGITSHFQMKMTPQSPDPAQQQMMKMMPWMMMFIMSTFASGLLIYYITSNTLTILQQWYLYRKHPVLKAQAAKDAADAAAKRAADSK